MSLGTGRDPLVSVVIRSYQAAQSVRHAIASVLGQTQEDLECLVIDDGSTDETQEASSVSDRRLRYVRLPANLGRAAALKVGIALSRGQFIGIADADDWWYPSKLQLQLDALARLSDVAFVTTNLALVSPSGSLSAVEGIRSGPDDLVRFAPMSRPGQRRLPHAPSLFRAAALREAPIDIGLIRCSDLYLTQEVMLRRACAILTLPLYAYHYPQSASVYEDCNAAARRIYGKFFTRYPATSGWLQAVCGAKQLTYRASAVTGVFPALLRRRGQPATPAELAAFLSAKAEVERAMRALVVTPARIELALPA